MDKPKQRGRPRTKDGVYDKKVTTRLPKSIIDSIEKLKAKRGYHKTSESVVEIMEEGIYSLKDRNII